MRTPLVALAALSALAACSRDAAKTSSDAHESIASEPAGGAAAALESACAAPGETVDKGEGCAVERVRAGTGARLAPHDVALVRYSLRLDGADTIVASTDGWTTPARIPMTPPPAAPRSSDASGVIRGFARALAGECIGSKLTARIPAPLAYGSAGLPSAGIPADAALVAEIEIVGATR